MASVTREEMLEYLRRYQAVNDFVQAERRQTPINVRLRQVLILADFARSLPMDQVDREHLEAH